MIRLIYILALFLIPILCSAKCVTKDFEILNTEDTISHTAKIVINFYEYRRYFTDSTRDISIIAITNGKKYQLNLLKIVDGYNLTQAIFYLPDLIETGKCAIAIKPLSMKSAIGMESILIGSDGYEPKIIHEFYVYNTVGDMPGAWIGTPVLEKAEFEKLGCGDEIYSEFSIPNSFDDDVIYEVTLTSESVTPEIEMAFINHNSNDKFYIGHNMCYGTFNLRHDQSYFVKIRAYSPKFNTFSDAIEFKIEQTK